MIDNNTMYFFFEELNAGIEKEAGISTALATTAKKGIFNMGKGLGKAGLVTAGVGGLGYLGYKALAPGMKQKAQDGANPFYKQAGIGTMFGRGLSAVGNTAQKIGKKGVLGGAAMTAIGLYGANKFRQNLKKQQPQNIKPMTAQTGMGRY